MLNHRYENLIQFMPEKAVALTVLQESDNADAVCWFIRARMKRVRPEAVERLEWLSRINMDKSIRLQKLGGELLEENR